MNSPLHELHLGLDGTIMFREISKVRVMARIDSQLGNKPLGSTLSDEQTEFDARQERVGQADDKTVRALPRICVLKRR